MAIRDTYEFMIKGRDKRAGKIVGTCVTKNESDTTLSIHFSVPEEHNYVPALSSLPHKMKRLLMANEREVNGWWDLTLLKASVIERRVTLEFKKNGTEA